MRMELQLEDRVVIVTGASRGIGRAIALAFAREHARLVVCARGREALEETAAALHGAGAGGVRALAVDITDAAAVPALLEAAVGLGGLDVVVGNAGGNRRKLFADTTDDDWRELLELNLVSGLRLARGAVPLFRARGRGSILFIASIWGREAGGPEYTIYNATKSALISAARVMATELAPAGIRVNTIAPGSILAPGGSWERRRQQDPAGIAAFVERELPLGRFGTAEEVAELAVFLASDRASLITGACIAADGGQGHSLI
jgi:3-oxoacyl-[acyl-carrier protein] reductase